MRRTLLSLALLLVALGVAVPQADAFVRLPNGINPEISWRLPFTNTDGSALTDLQETRVYWRLGTGVETMVVVPSPTQAPTAATPVQMKNDILAPVLPCQNQTLSVQLTAVDTTNNESARTAIATLVADRRNECVPNIPTGLTVQ